MSLENNPQIELAAPAVESAGDSRMRVLAVDDSPFSRKLLEHALRGQPYELAREGGAIRHGIRCGSFWLI